MRSPLTRLFPGIRLVLRPIGVDLDYILPSTKSNEAGAYSFEHVCAGRFTTLVDDEQAGYPPEIWSYLLGYKHEAKVTPSHVRIELPVVVPPKAALLKIVARNRRTNVSIPRCKSCSGPPRSKCMTGLRLRMNRASHCCYLQIQICCVVCWREDTVNGRKAGKKVSKPDLLLATTLHSMSCWNRCASGKKLLRGGI